MMAEYGPAIVLCVINGLVVGLVATAVRTQLAILDGFDFMIAALILTGSELFVAISNLGSPGGLFMTGMSVVLVTILIAWVWIRLMTLLSIRPRVRPMATLVISLAISMAASGIVALARGPGLAVPAGRVHEATVLGPLLIDSASQWVGVFGIGLTLFVVLTRLRRRGLALELLALSPEFASQIGIEVWGLKRHAALLVGAVAGTAGIYVALSGGSTPSSGHEQFMLGACGALLIGRSLLAALLGGFFVGSLQTGVEIVSSPATGRLLVFSLLLALLIARGSDRSARGER